MATRFLIKATNAAKSVMPSTAGCGGMCIHPDARRQDFVGRICDGANSLSISANKVPSVDFAGLSLRDWGLFFPSDLQPGKLST